MTPVRAMKTLIASIQKDLLAVLVNRDLMEMELFAKVRIELLFSWRSNYNFRGSRREKRCLKGAAFYGR